MNSIERIANVAQTLFDSPNFLPFINEGKNLEDVRTGGYLCILENIDNACGDEPAMKLVKLGTFVPEKAEAYLRNAQEKAMRILETPGLRSSWETRNVSKEQYGGGIRTDTFILSFSGLPELVDEAFVLSVAFECRLAGPRYLYQEIAKLSGSDAIFHGFLKRQGWGTTTSL
jgi:hypothetical protein